jgi:urease accessory protein
MSDNDSGRWLPHLLRILDSSYPTGGYAHSGGLEGLIDLGTLSCADDIRRHLEVTVIPWLERSELPLICEAGRLLAEEPVDWSRVRRLAEVSQAMRATRESREASATIARQRLDLLCTLSKAPLAIELSTQGIPDTIPLVTGLEGKIFAIPLNPLLAGFAQAHLTAQVAAAMKLLRIGQNAAQTILIEMSAKLPAVVARALAIAPEDAGWFNPWLDIAQSRHERARARLFIS